MTSWASEHCVASSIMQSSYFLVSTKLQEKIHSLITEKNYEYPKIILANFVSAIYSRANNIC